MGPPPSERCVRCEAGENHGRQVHACLGLLAVGFDQARSEFVSDPALLACQDGHHDQRHDHEHDPGSADIGLLARQQRADRVDPDQRCEGEKRDPDDLQRALFDLLRAPWRLPLDSDAVRSRYGDHG